jgi:HTH-type transcriptional regulator / antitoxin HigA
MTGSGGKMTATKRKKFNPRIYGELLLDVLPRPIETEAENERALAVVDRLMSKGEDNLTPEETTLLELLVQLIERFEERTYPIPEAPGYRALQTLMKSRGLKQADLLPIFGSRGIASEAYNGKRAISKTQAKKLGEFFGISPAVFI